MELGEWVSGRMIENSDNKKLDNRCSTVLYCPNKISVKKLIS